MSEKSLYAKYLEERQDAEVFEDKKGFVTFKKENDYIYLIDMYILPEYRESGICKTYVNKLEELAKDLKLNKIVTSLYPKIKNSNRNLNIILKCGFEVISCDTEMIYFIKNI
jgi:GNAT superfamily N-acetyltransferase